MWLPLDNVAVYILEVHSENDWQVDLCELYASEFHASQCYMVRPYL